MHKAFNFLFYKTKSLERSAGRIRTVSWLSDKFLMMAGYITLYLALFYGYYVYLVPSWGYYGFLWHPDWTKIIEAMAWTTIISWILPVSIRKPSDFYIHLQFLVPILPMLVMYGALALPRPFMHAVLFSFGVMLLIVKRIRFKPVRTPNINPKDLQLLLLFIGYLVVASIIFQGGWRYFNIDLTKVYTYREAAASYLPSFYGYLNPWVSKVVFPFSLLLATLTRKKMQAFLALTGSVLMFGLTSHKGALFYPFVVLLFYWIVGRKKSLLLLLVGYCFVIILSLIDYWLGVFQGWVATLMLRRSIFVPALLSFDYYDFFSRHGFVYWAQSKVAFGMLSYRYSLSIPHLIGLHYFNNPATGANTGWLGSGYANAGIMGMLIYAILIGGIFLLLDAYTIFHDQQVLIAIFVAPLLAVMVSSDLPTALLTHGTLIGLLLLTFFRTRHLTTREG